MNFEECYWFCRGQTDHIRSITLDGESMLSNTRGICSCHTNETTFVNKEYDNLQKDKYYLLLFGSICSFESVPTCK